MTVIDPNTGLTITCEPWEYSELCRQHGWIKTTYETNTVTSKAKPYKPGIPQRERFERMSQKLRDWIEKEPKTEHIEVNFIVNEKANDGRKGIQFIDAGNSSLFDIIIWDWPRIGLVDGAVYTPDELLTTGEAGKE